MLNNPANIPDEYIRKQRDRLSECHMNMPKSLVNLYREILHCKRCPFLVQSRGLYMWSKPTFGYGNPRAGILLIAQSPGYKGCGTTGFPFEPFSRTGQVYEDCLTAGGLTFEDVWTTNLVKCCPDSTTTPSREEFNSCAPFLVREIKMVGPEVLIAIGKPAHNFIVGQKLYLSFKTYSVHHPGYYLRKHYGMDDYMVKFKSILEESKEIIAKQKSLESFL